MLEGVTERARPPPRRERVTDGHARAHITTHACSTTACVALAGDDRDIDLYHWSSERFSAARKTTISVLVAKGRARVGVAAAATDWPKRIRDIQFLDHEGDPTAA